MKAVVAAFNQGKALVGAFSVIVQPVVEPMEHYTALILDVDVGRWLTWDLDPVEAELGHGEGEDHRLAAHPL